MLDRIKTTGNTETKPYRKVRFGRGLLKLDLRWPHERQYYEYITQNAFFSAIEFDGCVRNILCNAVTWG